MTAETILAALLALNPATLARDLSRARVVAQAIDSAALEATCSGPWASADWCRVAWPGTRVELAAVLIVQGTRESAFAENVHAGMCGPRQCDSVRIGGQLVFLAVSPWQLHRSRLVPERVWSALAGTELVPTQNAAYATARVLGAGYRACGDLSGGFAMAARGSGCRWVGAARRVAAVRRVESQLRAAPRS